MTATTRVTGSANDLLTAVLDDGTFRSWDTPADPPEGTSKRYSDELAAARVRSGTDEAVITGEGQVSELRLAIVASEFGFLAGSVGATAARRLVTAVERATAERLPLLLSPSSGGTRMQEGTPAFIEMIRIADRIAAHRRAGLPVVVHLRHPTTGGALASWGSLGSVTTAEPAALIAFLGPKVARALNDEAVPAAVQTAENLRDRGIIDAVVGPAELVDLLKRVLSLTARRAVRGDATPGPAPQLAVAPDAWASITATRRADRPGVRQLLAHEATEVVELHGTGAGETASATLLCFARLRGASCVLIGQDRTAGRPPGPADLRVARRGFALARDLRLPLVTVIDTPGGAITADAENGALAGEIARCLAELTALTVPSVAVLAGQGAGGMALALFATQRRIAASHAWLTPLPPEGASVIVHGTPDHAAAVVMEQRVRSIDLLESGAVDRIVPELPDAADEPIPFLARVADAIEEELRVLMSSAAPPTGSSAIASPLGCTPSTTLSRPPASPPSCCAI